MKTVETLKSVMPQYCHGIAGYSIHVLIEVLYSYNYSEIITVFKLF